MTGQSQALRCQRPQRGTVLGENSSPCCTQSVPASTSQSPCPLSPLQCVKSTRFADWLASASAEVSIVPKHQASPPCLHQCARVKDTIWEPSLPLGQAGNLLCLLLPPAAHSLGSHHPGPAEGAAGLDPRPRAPEGDTHLWILLQVQTGSPAWRDPQKPMLGDSSLREHLHIPGSVQDTQRGTKQAQPSQVPSP